MQTDYKISWVLRSGSQTKVVAKFYESENYDPPEGEDIERSFLREEFYEFDEPKTDEELRYFLNEELAKDPERIPIPVQTN